MTSTATDMTSMAADMTSMAADMAAGALSALNNLKKTGLRYP